MQLTDTQLTEIYTAARKFTEQQKLDELKWDDAWSGTYPDKPTEEETGMNFTVMKEMVERIIESEDFLAEYDTPEKRGMMIYLEACPSLTIKGCLL